MTSKGIHMVRTAEPQSIDPAIFAEQGLDYATQAGDYQIVTGPTHGPQRDQAYPIRLYAIPNELVVTNPETGKKERCDLDPDGNVVSKTAYLDYVQLSVGALILGDTSIVRSQLGARVIIDSAYVSDATIGDDTVISNGAMVHSALKIDTARSSTVGRNVTIRPEAEIIDSCIGDGCIIGEHASIQGSALGRNVVVADTNSSASIQYLGEYYGPQTTIVTSQVGERATICPEVSLNKSHIGARALVGNNVQLDEDPVADGSYMLAPSKRSVLYP